MGIKERRKDEPFRGGFEVALYFKSDYSRVPSSDDI